VNEFGILTNRKRAVIALAHSIVFLLIALRSLASGRLVNAIWLQRSAVIFGLLILTVYLVVSSVLVYLVRISRCAREKLYFGFCASSASVGLLRTIFGDPAFHGGQFLRVLMLCCAVITGFVILRGHSKANELLPAASLQESIL
jgi:hypothetical protein